MADIPIIIADDHPVFRAGLRKIIETDRGFRIVGEAADGQEALACIERECPRVAVLDLDMPKCNGLEAAREIQRRKLPVAVVILTMYDEEDLFEQAMECGVAGYILKDSAVTDIIRGMQTVADGRYFISPSLAHHLAKREQRFSAPRAQRLGLSRLTTTERTVLRLIAQSKSTRDIAEELGISERTVENHRAHISTKLQLSGSLSVLRFALENRASI